MLTKEIAHEYLEYRKGKLYWKKSTNRRIQIGKEAGTITNENRIQIKINGKFYLAHRIVFLMFHGYMPVEIDHRDNNPSNNSIENLREANRSEQACNKIVQSNNKIQIKGVSWSKVMKKWRVTVKKKYQVMYNGYFENLELAELVAIEARNKHHGDFAR